MWSALISILAMATLTFSETAHAGLLSYMSTLFGSEQAAAKVGGFSGGNSQTIALLQAANSLDPNPEKPIGVVPVVGNTLVADVALADSFVSSTANTQISLYTVHEGDTLSGIADMFDVSVNTIMWANDIGKSTSLRAGQTLVILPVTGINYAVKKGDTIKGIALKYKADVDEILQYNDLTLASTLSVGQIIIIPDAEQPLIQTKFVSSGNSAHDTNGPSYAGYYIRPVSGGIKTQGLHGYNGVDIASYAGAPIYAAAAGKVIVSSGSGWNGGYGNLIIISHDNGTQTVYSHLSKNLVIAGQYVEQGQKIGLMGATGKVQGVTGVHLHFEIRGAKNPF
jgi:LysM repeat protein